MAFKFIKKPNYYSLNPGTLSESMLAGGIFGTLWIYTPISILLLILDLFILPGMNIKINNSTFYLSAACLFIISWIITSIIFSTRTYGTGEDGKKWVFRWVEGITDVEAKPLDLTYLLLSVSFFIFVIIVQAHRGWVQISLIFPIISILLLQYRYDFRDNSVSVQDEDQGDMVKTFHINYGGDFTIKFNIDREEYNEKLKENVELMPHNSEEFWKKNIQSRIGGGKALNEIMQQLEKIFKNKNFNEYDQVCFIVNMIQNNDNIKYEDDDKIIENYVLPALERIGNCETLITKAKGQKEYCSTPVEVLANQCGDCDCKTVLTATLLNLFNFDVILLNPTGHLALGISGAPNLPGQYIRHNNKHYYYFETTHEGWHFGMVPPEFSGDDIKILPFNRTVSD